MLIGATTENPCFTVNSALVSRSQIFQCEPLSEADIKTLMRRALEDTECLVLSRWDFLAEVHSSPDIAAGVLPVLSRRLREANEELAER